MNDETKDRIDEEFKCMFGLSYDDFSNLDYDEQERLINLYHKKNPPKKKSDTTVMIGSGSDAIFMKVEKGTRIMLEDGTFIRAGKTLEEERMKLEARSDSIVCSKPVALIKKLVRKIK